MKESGISTTLNMDVELNSLKMVKFTKATGKALRSMVEVEQYLQMAWCTKAIGSMGSSMAMESKAGQMVR